MSCRVWSPLQKACGRNSIRREWKSPARPMFRHRPPSRCPAKDREPIRFRWRLSGSDPASDHPLGALPKPQHDPPIKNRVSKNAVLGPNFFPGFWTLGAGPVENSKSQTPILSAITLRVALPNKSQSQAPLPCASPFRNPKYETKPMSTHFRRVYPSVLESHA